MVELHVLGSLHVRRGGRSVPRVASHPRRAALLVYLALAARDGFVPRAALLRVLWPKHRPEPARRALRQALYDLRAALGAKVIPGRGRDEVGVSPAGLRCDATEFLEAMAAGRYADALALHQGDLLPGFSLPEAPAFMRWLDEQRTTLRREAARAALSLAQEARIAATPRDTAVVVPQPTPAAALPRVAVRRLPRRVLVAAAVVILAAGAWIVRAVTGTAHAERADPAGRVLVLPFVADGNATQRYLGEGIVDLLGASMHGAGTLDPVDATLTLTAARGRDAVLEGSAIARRYDARYFLGGSVTATGNEIHILAALYDGSDTASAPLSLAVAKGPATRLQALVDTVADQLFEATGRAPANRLVRSGVLTTQSIPALRAWLEGEQALRAGRTQRALDLFLRAAAFDTGFALAHYRVSVASRMVGDNRLMRGSIERARRHSRRLSERDRALVLAHAAWIDRLYPEAERLYQLVVNRYPDDVESRYLLADLYFHQASWTPPVRDGSAAVLLGKAREGFGETVRLVPNHVGALLHLARIHAWFGDTVSLRRVERSFRVLGMTDPRRSEVRALAAYSSGKQSERARFLREMRTASAADVVNAGSALAIWARNLDGAREVTSLLVERGRDPQVRANGHLRLALLDLARDHRTEAREQVRLARTLSSAAVLSAAHLALLPFATRDSIELPRLRADLAAWAPRPWDAPDAASAPLEWHPHLRYYYLGLLSLELGDRGAALAMADSIAALPQAAPAALALELGEGLRAAVEIAEGDRRSALRRLDALQLGRTGSRTWMPRSRHFWMLGELNAAADRRDEAAAWLELLQFTVQDLPYTARALRLAGELR